MDVLQKSTQHSAISQSIFTAKGAKPPRQAKTGLDGPRGTQRKTGVLRINADWKDKNLTADNADKTDLRRSKQFNRPF
jgi:hypothetical protein